MRAADEIAVAAPHVVDSRDRVDADHTRAALGLLAGSGEWALRVMALDGSWEEAHDMTASEQLRDMVNGFRISQALHVAAVLGVSDLLADGPLDLESLARAADADPESLRRLLRALAAVGVYVETDEGGYANSELSGPCVPVRRGR